MEKPQPVKGTVTSLSSLFPAEEANKATKRVQDAVVEKQQELDIVTGFINDNSSHINLVQKLPHELHHDIMVPFGKAAFFLGRTVHTNELTVFEGENYYVDRTAKQTIDILKRRGKVLQSQVDSLKAHMEDLKVEALFFNTTASESMEGLVEIREDYPEESSTQTVDKSGQLKQDSALVSETDNKKVATEDEEYARIMARFDELEKEELAAGSDYENDEDVDEEDAKADSTESNTHEEEGDEDDATESDTDEEESDEDDETEESGDGVEEVDATVSNHQNSKDDQNTAASLQKLNLSSSGHNLRYSGESKQGNLSQPTKDSFSIVSPDNIPRGSGDLLHGVRNSNPAQKPPLHSEVKQRVEAMPLSGTMASGQASMPEFDSSKAFTGSIVEHSHNLLVTSQTPASQPSKPVSRFKLQRK